MSSIDNIINKLKVEAEEKISAIEVESARNVEKLKSELMQKANIEKDKILNSAREKANTTYNRISENAELRIRDQRLRERQNLINRVFDLVLEKMNSKSDSEFIAEIKSALKKIGGEDLTLQIPKNRLEALKKEKLGITIDEENFVENGFVVMSDKMNYNFKYEDILNDARDKIGPELIDFLSN